MKAASILHTALILLFACPILSAVPCAHAQTTPAPAPPGGDADDDEDSDNDGIRGWWECECPGGTFVVKLDQISSLSKHTYVVDGAARVYEVTVSTSGPVIGRFYYIEPVTDESPLAIGKVTLDRLRSIAEGISDRTGTSDVWTEVVKNYPETTHAKTSEYRLSGVDQIEKIYAHAYRVWAQEKGRGSDNKVKAE